MEKIFITGGTGFIGCGVVKKIKQDKELECYVLTRKKVISDDEKIHYLNVDITDVILLKKFFYDIKPDTLVHLAWHDDKMNYMNSDDNYLYLNHSIVLLRLFLSAGGKNVIVSGTCAEYDWSQNNIHYEDEYCLPLSVYGMCKLELYNICDGLCKEYGVRLVWGRVFFCYGPGEGRYKLLTMAYNEFCKGNVFICKRPSAYLDYIFVEDVTNYFMEFIINKKINGIINICTGKPIYVFDLINSLASKMGKSDKSFFNSDEQNMVVIGSIKKAQQYNLFCRYSIDMGIEEYITQYD